MLAWSSSFQRRRIALRRVLGFESGLAERLLDGPLGSRLRDGLDGSLGRFLELLLQGGEQRPCFHRRGLCRAFARGGVQLLFGFLDQACHLLLPGVVMRG